MREIDRIAIEEVGPNLFQMMENAGRNLASVALDMLPAGRTRTVLVLAGTGGNGGGGLAAGRHLANHGVRVLTSLTSAYRLGEVPAAQLALLRHAGGEVTTTPPAEVDLVVDALIGYSLRGAPTGVGAELIEWVASVDAPILSLDVPSGLEATTGETPGAVVAADRTLTLALPKTGLCHPAAGALTLGDIGIPAEVYRRAGVAGAADVFRDRYLVPLRRNVATNE